MIESATVGVIHRHNPADPSLVGNTKVWADNTKAKNGLRYRRIEKIFATIKESSREVVSRSIIDRRFISCCNRMYDLVSLPQSKFVSAMRHEYSDEATNNVGKEYRESIDSATFQCSKN